MFFGCFRSHFVLPALVNFSLIPIMPPLPLTLYHRELANYVIQVIGRVDVGYRGNYCSLQVQVDKYYFNTCLGGQPQNWRRRAATPRTGGAPCLARGLWFSHFNNVFWR